MGREAQVCVRVCVWVYASGCARMQMSIESNSSVIRRKNDKQQLFGRYSLIADGNMGGVSSNPRSYLRDAERCSVCHVKCVFLSGTPSAHLKNVWQAELFSERTSSCGTISRFVTNLSAILTADVLASLRQEWESRPELQRQEVEEVQVQ